MKYVWASNVLRGLNLPIINAFVLNRDYYSIKLRMIGAKWIFSRKNIWHNPIQNSNRVTRGVKDRG